MAPELPDVAARELAVVFLAVDASVADASVASVLYAVSLALVPRQTPFC